VWAATHLVLASAVAIKFLDRLRGGDPEEIELRVDRFRFEAQLSARLSSQTKHMVAVHDAGMHLGMPYLVMEFAPGESLQDLLDKRGRLAPEWLVPVVEQVAEALDAAHRNGIVHRDVKPGNILLLERRAAAAAAAADADLPKEVFAKLADFGVAKPSEGSEIDLVAPKQTAEGLIVGSPAYMSPEQIAGVSAASGASDRWSLGIVMYEAVTGWLPFRGESLTDFAIGITTREPDPPSSVVEALTPAVDAFFVRALAKKPEDRYPTAAEMTRAFREAVEASDEVPVVVPTRATRSWVWLAAAATFVLVLGAGWLIVSGMPGTQSTRTAEGAEEGAEAGAPAQVPAVAAKGAPPGGLASPTVGGSAVPAITTAPTADAAPSSRGAPAVRPTSRPARPRTPGPPATSPTAPTPPASTSKHLDPSEVH